MSAWVNGEGVCTPGDTRIASGSPSSQTTQSTGSVRLPPACVLMRRSREGTGAGARSFLHGFRSQSS